MLLLTQTGTDAVIKFLTTTVRLNPNRLIMRKKKTATQERFESKREYKFDTAMKDAARKARACHPRLVAMSSNVPEKR